MAINYRLKIVNGNEQFEAEGDKKFVLDMWRKFQEMGEISTSEVTNATKTKRAAGAPSRGKPLSIGEFIRQLGIKKHTDFILAFGYYLEKYTGLNEFGTADINKCYYEAKMESSNTTQMLIQNIKRGYVMPSKAPKKKGLKQYVLTGSGEEFIKKLLENKNAV